EWASTLYGYGPRFVVVAENRWEGYGMYVLRISFWGSDNKRHEVATPSLTLLSGENRSHTVSISLKSNGTYEILSQVL
ncbi:MAG: hypothetical protein AB1744_13700, partial [Candidatus Zixiibacteriota bacterium]